MSDGKGMRPFPTKYYCKTNCWKKEQVFFHFLVFLRSISLHVFLDKQTQHTRGSVLIMVKFWKTFQILMSKLDTSSKRLYGSPIRGLGEDKMCWIPSKVKGFLVSDYYRILVGTTFYGFPWKSIWKQKMPPK